MLSPCIAAGTVTQTAYNHYSMLRSFEDMFALAHLGYANLPGQTTFGTDLLNRQCGPQPPSASVTTPALLSTVATTPQIPVQWSSSTTNGTPLATYTVQARDLSVAGSPWTTIASLTQNTSLTYVGAAGHTYDFQVQATNMAGQASASASAQTVVPSGPRPSKAHFRRHWKFQRAKGAWNGHVITTKTKGATVTLTYTGGSFELIGETGRHGGRARLTIDGHRHTVDFFAPTRHNDQILFSAPLSPGVHHLKLKVLRGSASIEGFAITARVK